MLALECAVFGSKQIVTNPAAGWFRLWITNAGVLVFLDLGKGILAPQILQPVVEQVDVCGQLDALVACERFLERGTFEPAPEAAEARPVDAFAELT